MKKLQLVSLFALAIFAFSACKNGTTTTTTQTNSGGEKKADAKALKLAFVTNNASDFWTIARKGVEKADGELDNVTVEFKMPGEGTAAEQKRIIDDLLSVGVNGIAISPKDPQNQTPYINEVAKKALVITQDSDAANSDRAVYIGTDNVAAGRQAGELLKEALPNGGKVMVFVGDLDSANSKERLQGIKEVINGTKIEIIDVRTDGSDHAKAKSNVADTLVKYGDISGLVGLWSYNGPAILSAVKDANKVGQVKIVAFDEDKETLAGVREGAIAGTVVQQPFEFGYQSVIAMNKILSGDKSFIPANKQIIVPTLAIKKDGVDAFEKKLKELTGK